MPRFFHCRHGSWCTDILHCPFRTPCSHSAVLKSCLVECGTTLAEHILRQFVWGGQLARFQFRPSADESREGESALAHRLDVRCRNGSIVCVMETRHWRSDFALFSDAAPKLCERGHWQISRGTCRSSLLRLRSGGGAGQLSLVSALVRYSHDATPGPGWGKDGKRPSLCGLRVGSRACLSGLVPLLLGGAQSKVKTATANACAAFLGSRHALGGLGPHCVEIGGRRARPCVCGGANPNQRAMTSREGTDRCSPAVSADVWDTLGETSRAGSGLPATKESGTRGRTARWFGPACARDTR